MVCVPCIFIPILLFLWHKFVQPYVLRWWNPWAEKDDKGQEKPTEFPFQCKGDSCPFPMKKQVSDKPVKSNDSGDEKSKVE